MVTDMLKERLHFRRMERHCSLRPMKEIVVSGLIQTGSSLEPSSAIFRQLSLKLHGPSLALAHKAQQCAAGDSRERRTRLSTDVGTHEFRSCSSR